MQGDATPHEDDVKTVALILINLLFGSTWKLRRQIDETSVAHAGMVAIYRWPTGELLCLLLCACCSCRGQTGARADFFLLSSILNIRELLCVHPQNGYFRQIFLIKSEFVDSTLVHSCVASPHMHLL